MTHNYVAPHNYAAPHNYVAPHNNLIVLFISTNVTMFSVRHRSYKYGLQNTICNNIHIAQHTNHCTFIVQYIPLLKITWNYINTTHYSVHTMHYIVHPVVTLVYKYTVLKSVQYTLYTVQ